MSLSHRAGARLAADRSCAVARADAPLSGRAVLIFATRRSDGRKYRSPASQVRIFSARLQSIRRYASPHGSHARVDRNRLPAGAARHSAFSVGDRCGNRSHVLAFIPCLLIMVCPSRTASHVAALSCGGSAQWERRRDAFALASRLWRRHCRNIGCDFYGGVRRANRCPYRPLVFLNTVHLGFNLSPPHAILLDGARVDRTLFYPLSIGLGLCHL